MTSGNNRGEGDMWHCDVVVETSTTADIRTLSNSVSHA